MTLYELVASVNLQGDIRISKFDGDEEKVLGVWEECEHLYCGELDDTYGDLEVDYIFCPGDGFLHIELKNED